MKRKITIFDKIFSFRESIVKQYIINELGDFYDKINLKNDLVRRHWMFFFLKSFYIFIFLFLFIIILYFFSKYHLILHEQVGNRSSGINFFILIGSVSVIFLFLVYTIKAKLINKIGIIFGFFLAGIKFLNEYTGEINYEIFLEGILSTACILIFVFLIEIILKSLKIIYNILIDYKNDFIVIYPEGLYISEKTGALDHEYQRILFDEIVDVSSYEKGILGGLFHYGQLKISIMGTGSDYLFEYCANITRVPTKLNQKRIYYLGLKKMRGKKDEKRENKIKTTEPFKSKIRDHIIDVLNLKSGN